jgi:alkylation response protein AidB-like acyl-CoA dehydrogenase
MALRIPLQYRTAESFERDFGDPADPTSRLSFAAALELDEREEYPSEHHALLDSWRFPELYIPAECGGQLKSFEEVFALLRALARRDLTVAVSHMITFLGALPVWIAGSDDQKQQAAALIRGGCKIAFALTERAHGADLLANELEAREEGDRLLISGEKWLIGNATRSTAMTVFARTRAAGGPRGFSLLFADKRLLDPAAFHHLPKVNTVGLRGSDLSGIWFDRCAAPSSARIGPEGSGFELALKALQITRILCTGLSLGAGDTALRLAVDFALTRRLYGGNVFDIPHARSTLSTAFIDLLICDCVAISAARALQACPGQASVWSAVAKYLVPTTVEKVMRDLSVVFGARFFLRNGHPWNMFQKMSRDSSIVSVLEGSTLVQLHALGLQLEQLTTEPAGSGPDSSRRLEMVFSLRMPLPGFDPQQLDLFSRNGNDVVAGIPLLDDQLRSVKASEALLQSVHRVSVEHRRLTAALKEAHGLPGRSVRRLQLAQRFAQLHAAACCSQFWIHNRDILGEFFGREEWLSSCLNRLLSEDGTIVEDGYVERELLDRFRRHRLFSAVPLQLAFERRDAEVVGTTDE